MPKHEILHSGQYWQDLRRRSKEAKAARAAREEQAETFGADLCNSARVYTFVPGSAVPFTSWQQRSGKLVPLSGPSSSGQHEAARLAVLRRKHLHAERAARAKKLEEVLGLWILSAPLLTSFF
jgi:hypothetical protein